MIATAIERECRCPQCGNSQSELIRPARLDSSDELGLGVQGSRPGGNPLLFDRRCPNGHTFAEPA